MGGCLKELKNKKNMITKADIEKRLNEVELEQVRVVAQTIGTYEGSKQELKRLLSSFNSSDKLDSDKSNQTETKEK